MSDAPPPPPYGGDPHQPAPPTTPYAQQPYQQGVPYGNPQLDPSYGAGVHDHPQATTILVLGILGIVACGVLAPFAWVMGSRALAEIDASRGQIGGRNSVQAGRICGIVGTVLMGLGVVLLLFLLVVAAGTSVSGY